MARITICISNHESISANAHKTVQEILEYRPVAPTQDDRAKKYLQQTLQDLVETETYIPFHPWIMPLSTPQNHTWKAVDLLTGKLLVVRKDAEKIELLYRS